MSGLRSNLRRFWFRFKGEPRELPEGAVLGYGITAVDRPDAEELLSARLLGGAPLPAGAEVIEDVDVSTLDEGHVLPNMGGPTVRGLWYPRV